jgi:hypothetical protein
MPRADRFGVPRGYYHWYKISKKGLDRAQYFLNRRSVPSFKAVVFGKGGFQDVVMLHVKKDLDNDISAPSDPILRRGIEAYQNIVDAYRPYAIMVALFPGFFDMIPVVEEMDLEGGRVMMILNYLQKQGLIPDDYNIVAQVYTARKEGWSDMEILLLMLLKSLKAKISNLK